MCSYYTYLSKLKSETYLKKDKFKNKYYKTQKRKKKKYLH